MTTRSCHFSRSQRDDARQVQVRLIAHEKRARLDQRIADLLALLELEQLEVNLFRGESRDIGSPQVFGGQVLGQALNAASATVEGRIVHSLHAYFLRRGDFNAPIVYQVDRSRMATAFPTAASSPFNMASRFST